MRGKGGIPPGSDVAIAVTPDQGEHRINDRIRAREVRLIDPDGKQLGVKALPEAMAIARSMDLDLVEVAAEANPPVCRIMDFNRFKYETAQRAKESRKKTTSTSIKEMKYRPKIGVGDFDTKTRQVARFLGEGHKVKITIMFRGREMSHPELGKKILDHVAETVGEVAKVEAEPKLDGRNMIMVLAPDRRAQQAAAKAGSTRATAATDETAPTNGTAPDAPAAASPATPAPATPESATPAPATPESATPESAASTAATSVPATSVPVTSAPAASAPAPSVPARPAPEPAAVPTTASTGASASLAPSPILSNAQPVPSRRGPSSNQ